MKRTSTTHKTPTTRNDALRYCDKVSRMYDAPPCEHGHFGCALWDGGPCSNEVAAQFDIGMDD